MAIQLRARGTPQGLPQRTLGRITRVPVEENVRADYIRVVPKDTPPSEALVGYAAALFEGNQTSEALCPSLRGYESMDFLQDGYVVALDPHNGFTRVLYRPESRYNTIFATERCNSNCLMCSQPPQDVNDDKIVEEHLRLIDLIPNTPEYLGISGGEPTLLKDGLIRILARLKERFPETFVLMLTNGRMFAYEDFMEKLAGVGHSKFLPAIPLYANNAVDHDYVVQAKGAFDQTVQGLYNAAKYNLAVEIRIVLHKQTIAGLLPLADFIYRNLPFVRHIALMGLENMGYVKKNWDLLWIDPTDYAETLEAAVRFFHYRRLNVSIYNLPLCLLPKTLWAFARKSISDFKNIYIEECEKCRVKKHCSGLFLSSERRHSRHIKAII